MKKIISVFLAIIMVTSMFSIINVNAATPLSLTASFNGNESISSVINGKTYLFIPATADLNSLFLSSNGKAVSINGIDISEGANINVLENSYFDEENNTYELDIKNGSSDKTIYIMKSENVDTMFISTLDKAYGRTWVEDCPRTAKTHNAAEFTTVTMNLTEANGNVIYDGNLTQLKGRGNSTWNHAKKPYQIKLEKKTDLLNTGNKDNKNKTWVLLANAYDKTLIRNAFTFDVAAFLGLNAPEYKFIDLFYDGEYRGSYLLCEKVQINPGRLEITSLEDFNEVADESATAQDTNSFDLTYQYNPTATCTTNDISGGYLLEEDMFYKEENSWFETIYGSYVVIKSPEFATKEQVKYISEKFNAMCSAARNDTYDGKKISAYADIESLSAYYALQEYTGNYDYMISSTYFYVPAKGDANYTTKIYGGPAWDFDCAYGIKFVDRGTKVANPDHLNFYRMQFNYSKDLHAACKKYFAKLDQLTDVVMSKAPVADTNSKVRSLRSYREFVDASRMMNFTIWPFDSVSLAFTLPSYEENYELLENYVQTRHPIMVNFATCNHMCHSDGFIQSFLWSIFSQLFQAFGLSKHCSCGLTHY